MNAKTVLLVDDDGDFVEMNRVVLEEKGYTVRTAFNGAQCMEQVTSDRPDVIILDMMMEDRNEGFNLSRELRNSEYSKDIPLIMITSVHETIPFRIEPDRTWLPVDALLEKPVDPVLLLSVVERILSR
jgi:CheY-like chemotaxis protein